LTLSIGDTAPDFEAADPRTNPLPRVSTTSWPVLFSHPKDFSSVDRLSPGGKPGQLATRRRCHHRRIGIQ
jgi:hypothetical protein